MEDRAEAREAQRKTEEGIARVNAKFQKKKEESDNRKDMKEVKKQVHRAQKRLQEAEDERI